MENKLKALVSQRVVKSSSGGGAGSTLVLELENKSYFFIWCTWRIQKADFVIVTSSDTIEPTENNSSINGFIGEKTPIIKGNKILDIIMTSQYDLKITFENNYNLHVFCDIGRSRDDYDINWELNIPKENLSIEITNNFEEKESDYY